MIIIIFVVFSNAKFFFSLVFFYNCHPSRLIALNYSCGRIMTWIMCKDSWKVNKILLVRVFRPDKMENRFQGKAPEDDVIGQNNKRPSISLNMGGLWDVVPRLDHYRYFYNWNISTFKVN